MRIHARPLALAALAALGLTLTGCDIVRQAVGLDGPAGPTEQTQKAETDNEGDCPACAKFKARPPSGLNAPPVL